MNRVSPRIRRTIVSALTSFLAGLLAGVVFRALHAPSPAPPWLGLTGLLGIVLGERAVTALRRSRKSSTHQGEPT